MYVYNRIYLETVCRFVRTYVHVHTSPCMYIHVHVYNYIHTYVWMNIQLCTDVWLYVPKYAMYVQTYVCA